MTKPILKWCGGKTKLLKHLLPKVPQHYGRYIEPFVGGGALFFALKPQQAIIADANPELINLYQALAKDVEQVLTELANFTVSEAEYYQVRALDWTILSTYQAAARMIYLNGNCFNGLYRISKTGKFNAPYGHQKKRTYPSFTPEQLRLVAAALQQVTIKWADYKTTLKAAANGDFVFLDPPYLGESKHTTYTRNGFNLNDHIELAAEVKRLQAIGAKVLITNSNHPFIYANYANLNIELIDTYRPVIAGRKTQDTLAYG